MFISFYSIHETIIPKNICCAAVALVIFVIIPMSVEYYNYNPCLPQNDLDMYNLFRHRLLGLLALALGRLETHFLIYHYENYKFLCSVHQSEKLNNPDLL